MPILLYMRSLRNFIQRTSDGMMASTHKRGAVIPTSVLKGFLRACILGSGAYSSHALTFKNKAETWGLVRQKGRVYVSD